VNSKNLGLQGASLNI